jgi:hypothetical protein
MQIERPPQRYCYAALHLVPSRHFRETSDTVTTLIGNDGRPFISARLSTSPAERGRARGARLKEMLAVGKRHADIGRLDGHAC